MEVGFCIAARSNVILSNEAVANLFAIVDTAKQTLYFSLKTVIPA
jgi:hypothetical protein